MGMKSAPKVNYYPVYRLDGNVSDGEVERIASKLLIDPITEKYTVSCPEESPAPRGKKAKKSREHNIEVWLKPGVTDTVAESVVKAIRDLGIPQQVKVKTGHKFVFKGTIAPAAVKQIAERLLVNPMIQEYTIQ
jgi:phosphoribosylformylglycinamidine synthase